MKVKTILFERDEYTIEFFKYLVQNKGNLENALHKFFDDNGILPFENMPSYFDEESYNRLIKNFAKYVDEYEKRVDEFSNKLSKKEFLTYKIHGVTTLDISKYTTILAIAETYLRIPEFAVPLAVYECGFNDFDSIIEDIVEVFKLNVMIFDKEENWKTGLYACREDFTNLAEDEFIDDADQTGVLELPCTRYNMLLEVSNYNYEAVARIVLCEFDNLNDFNDFIEEQSPYIQEDLYNIYTTALDINKAK